MSDNKKRVLDMLEAGKINAEEAMKLLSAMDDTDKESNENILSSFKKFKYLRVMVDNPQNPGYPQSWILRKRNSMQNAAYPGNSTVPVSTQKPLVLKYSLIVYSGSLSDIKIQEIIKLSW